MKKKLVKTIVPMIFPLLISTGESVAQDVTVDSFDAPKATKRFPAEYPSRQLQFGIEGAVEVNMMIDETGKPFEVTVVNSSGGQEFVREAVKAVKKWRFEPAKSEGKPVIAGTHTLMRFFLGDRVTASPDFIEVNKAFHDAVKSKSKEESGTLLVRLHELENNRYESAFVGLASYLYASKYGSSLEQMNFLDYALSFSHEKNDDVYLPKSDARLARRELMRLQVKNHYYQEAMRTYRYFGMVGDNEALEQFKPVMDQIAELEKNDTGYDIPAELNAGGRFNIRLLKHEVYATAVEGKVAEFRISCDKKFVYFPVEADVVYDIPGQWGVCALEIVGDAGTKLKLMQQ